MNSHITYRFGDFSLDPALCRLRCGEVDLGLPRKVFRCIFYLVEHRDRTVSHDELIQAIWGTTHLSDNVLAQAILRARHTLGDTGENQRFIETVRGFGYRWSAPVVVESTPEPQEVAVDDVIAMPAQMATIESTRTPTRRRLLSTSAVLLALLVLAGVVLLRPQYDSSKSATSSAVKSAHTGRNVALLLPVTVNAGSEHDWVRLGLMALIAERLHGGGQSMVPSDTVIALLRDQSSQPASAELTHLVATTDAQFVLAAEAQTTGTRWTVSLHTILGVQPPLTAVGEAHDVLEAAREATDRMLLELGFANSDGLSTEPGLQRLLQQIEAARLSQQTDVARALIESADPELRRSPEVRLQSARIEFYNHNLDAAQATFDSLIDEIGADNDPVLRARALNGRAAVYLRNGDPDAAAPLLSEAARILPAQNHTLEYLSSIQNNSAVMADMREDPNAASLHFAQARTILEGSGDVKGLATLDQNEGTLELRRERYTEALRHLESAAQRKAAVQDIGGELRALVCMIQAQLGLLDPQAALAIEPRVNELLARTTNEQLTAYAKIQLAYLMSELGRIRASESLMNEVLRVSELSDIPPAYGKIALLQRAERMAKVADFAAAAELAAKVVDGLADHTIGYEERARAWLLVIRANLALDRLAIADEARNAMAAWARDRMARSPKIYAALADAEIASFAGRTEAARTAFERAFSLADAGHAPVHLLRVAQGYVPWLLREDHATLRNRERARFLAERLAGYAQQHYGAALLQLYVHHSAGISPTWRASLARVTSLAGERQVPPALLEAPKSVGL